ncbi:MAG: NlpC/P60 family protein [Campylobacter sp.]
MNKISVFLLAILMSGCVNFSQKTPRQDITVSKTDQTKERSLSGTKSTQNSQNSVKISKQAHNLIDIMERYLGKKDGRDCSGFVSLINKKFDHTFFSEKQLSKFYTKQGLKSEAMFRLYESKKSIVFDNPQIGDLIFFNNTTRNTKNNKKSKIVTHVGIISGIDKDGTVAFMHNTRGINAVGYMNLNDKNTYKINKREINSYIVACKSKSVSCLTSNRFSGFGRTNIK